MQPATSYTDTARWNQHIRSMKACHKALNTAISATAYKETEIQNIVATNIEAMKNANIFEQGMPQKYRFMVFCTGFFGKAIGKTVSELLGIYTNKKQITAYNQYAQNRGSIKKIQKPIAKALTQENRKTIRHGYSRGRRLSEKYSTISIILSIGETNNHFIKRAPLIIVRALPIIGRIVPIIEKALLRTSSYEVRKIHTACHTHWSLTFPSAKPTARIQMIRSDERGALRVIRTTPFLTENSLAKINTIKTLATQIQAANTAFDIKQDNRLRRYEQKKLYEYSSDFSITDVTQ